LLLDGRRRSFRMIISVEHSTETSHRDHREQHAACLVVWHTMNAQGFLPRQMRIWRGRQVLHRLDQDSRMGIGVF
jgi:hypothetical protein